MSKFFNIFMQVMIAAFFSGMALSGCTQQVEIIPSSKVETSAAAETERVKAVLIYADWCNSCKVLEPKLAKVMPEFDGKGIEFIKLNYTDKDLEYVYGQADMFGVGKSVRAEVSEPVKTGEMLIIATSGDVLVSKVNMLHTEEEIAERFRRALQITN